MEESANHNLVPCKRTTSLGSLIFALFAFFWVVPCSVKDLLFQWHSGFFGKKMQRNFESSFHLIMLDNLEGNEQNF